MRVVYETPDKCFRIVECDEHHYELSDLKGDCFNPIVNPEIPKEELERQEIAFENLVNQEGVFGYVLQRWNGAPGCGYEHMDSCWGFVGRYSPKDRSGLFDHYIVDEMKGAIAELQAHGA